MGSRKPGFFAPLWFDNQAPIVILNAVIGKAFTFFASSHPPPRHISRSLRRLPGARFADRCEIFERRPEPVANRSVFQGQKMFFRVYASQKFHKMRRSLMFRKTLIPALVAGAALLVAGPSPASAGLFSYGGCGGGCGGYSGGCGGGCGGYSGGCGGGCHHHHVHHHHHGCGCGYSSCGSSCGGCGGCGAAPTCGAPMATCAAPMACAAAPSCCAPAATCCGSVAPTCAAPMAPSCGAPGTMAPAPSPVQAAPAPPPEEPAPKPKA